MRDRIATHAYPQRRRDDGGAVELLERAPPAFGREIACGPLECHGGDSPVWVGSKLPCTEHAGVAARAPGRQRVGKQARLRCGRRRRHRRHDDESRQNARRSKGARSLRQAACHRFGVHLAMPEPTALSGRAELSWVSAPDRAVDFCVAHALALQRRCDLQRAEQELGAKIEAIPTLKMA